MSTSNFAIMGKHLELASKFWIWRIFFDSCITKSKKSEMDAVNHKNSIRKLIEHKKS